MYISVRSALTRTPRPPVLSVKQSRRSQTVTYGQLDGKIPGFSKYAKLLKGEGLNHSILRKERISKNHHTVRRFYLCYREDSTINRHPGSGRPLKLAELSFAMVEQLIRQDNKTTATEMYYEQRCGCIVLWKKQYPLINQQHCSILSTSLLKGTLETGF